MATTIYRNGPINIFFLTEVIANFYRKQKESVQLMYLLSTQLGNLKVQLISILKFICQKGEL